MKKKFSTKYGYFTDDGTQYKITDWETPRPWVNVISNGSHGLVVSQVGGGFSWIEHSNLNRLTRWNQDLIRDNWGKYIYLRDDQSGEIWSPTVLPVRKAPDKYLCTHGAGFTEFETSTNGISSKLRIFVPFDRDLEIWTLTVKNDSPHQRQISAFTYFEWCLGAAPDNHREFHRSFIETSFDETHNALFAKKRLWEIKAERGHWNVNWDRTAYFACSEPVDGFDGDKASFIGMYQDFTCPEAVSNGTLGNKSGKWNDSIAALHKKLVLAPGETREIHFFLGAEKSEAGITNILKHYSQPEQVSADFSVMQEKWNEILATVKVETPDEALNFMTNTWLKYQAIAGRLWARAAYYQQSGAFGFRDQLQDSQIFLYIDPALTKKQLLLHARHQFSEGKVLHWWHPIIEEGLDANMTDDLLWLPFVLIQYLKETLDWSILEEEIPFYDNEIPASLLEHCIRAIDLVLSRMSQRGLPLILAGDWNDGLSAVGLEGKGESVWLAHFLYYILREIQPVLSHKKMIEKDSQYQTAAAELRVAINEVGWDGKWFWRASKDNGQLLGSESSLEGKLFLNAQTWAVISNSTSDDRQMQVMDAVEKQLVQDMGPVLFTPAYTKPDHEIGYLSRYAPGVRENGGVYTHAATWSVWAEAALGHCEATYDIHQKLNPIYKGMRPDDYVAEPYVTPGNIDGPLSPTPGKGGWTWYTGSAAWYFRVTLDHLLGIQADWDGLQIKPCVPDAMLPFSVKRVFRGVTCNIYARKAVEKADVPGIYADGRKVSENLVAFPQDGPKTVKIEIILA